MNRRFGFVLMMALGAVSGCTRPLFVDSGISVSVDKGDDLIRKTGQFSICHPNDDAATLAEVETLARETCAALGFEPMLTTRQHFQCRLLVPHRSRYQCVDSRKVNPFAKGPAAASRRAEAEKGTVSPLNRPATPPDSPLGLGAPQTLPPPEFETPAGGWGGAWENGETAPPKPGVPSALP